MAVVNEDNVEDFLHVIRELEVSNEELRKSLVHREYSHISDMIPSLYVDFDDKKLTSFYPEPASYELYVPNGWLGKYEQFMENIPVDYQYWIITGENLFQKENDNE